MVESAIGMALLAILMFVFGIWIGQRIYSYPNPCITTYEMDNHHVCVLDKKWGAYVR